jgi:hypothetical protein
MLRQSCSRPVSWSNWSQTTWHTSRRLLVTRYIRLLCFVKDIIKGWYLLWLFLSIVYSNFLRFLWYSFGTPQEIKHVSTSPVTDWIQTICYSMTHYETSLIHSPGHFIYKQISLTFALSLTSLFTNFDCSGLFNLLANLLARWNQIILERLVLL